MVLHIPKAAPKDPFYRPRIKKNRRNQDFRLQGSHFGQKESKAS